eukprot:5064987-Pyramimonas_sp.AAC.1
MVCRTVTGYQRQRGSRFPEASALVRLDARSGLFRIAPASYAGVLRGRRPLGFHSSGHMAKALRCRGWFVADSQTRFAYRCSSSVTAASS